MAVSSFGPARQPECRTPAQLAADLIDMARLWVPGAATFLGTPVTRPDGTPVKVRKEIAPRAHPPICEGHYLHLSEIADERTRRRKERPEVKWKIAVCKLCQGFRLDNQGRLAPRKAQP